MTLTSAYLLLWAFLPSVAVGLLSMTTGKLKTIRLFRCIFVAILCHFVTGNLTYHLLPLQLQSYSSVGHSSFIPNLKYLRLRHCSQIHDYERPFKVIAEMVRWLYMYSVFGLPLVVNCDNSSKLDKYLANAKRPCDCRVLCLRLKSSLCSCAHSISDMTSFGCRDQCRDSVRPVL